MAQRLQYYAVRRTSDGKRIEQVLVIHNGRNESTTPTGVYYKSDREASAALLKINCVWKLARPCSQAPDPAALPDFVRQAIGLA